MQFRHNAAAALRATIDGKYIPRDYVANLCGLSESDFRHLLYGELVLSDELSETLRGILEVDAQTWRAFEARYREQQPEKLRRFFSGCRESAGLGRGPLLQVAGDPTPEELAAAIKAIQAGWTPEERLSRLRGDSESRMDRKQRSRESAGAI